MLTIHTKYLAPTNLKGARIRAYTNDGLDCTIAYPYKFECAQEAHYQAVKALIDTCTINRVTNYIKGGQNCRGDGYTFLAWYEEN